MSSALVEFRERFWQEGSAPSWKPVMGGKVLDNKLDIHRVGDRCEVPHDGFRV